MSTAYSIGRVLGIPVKIHITLFLFLPLIGAQLAAAMGITSLLWGLVAAAGLFGSVALHELGHSVVALSKGIRVREILLLPIGGLAQLEHMPRRASDEMHIAIAGPVVSLFLAFFFGGVAVLFGGPGPGQIIYTFIVLGWMNLALALFNLLPSFPMDGGRIFRAWLTPRIGRVAATRIAARTGRFLAIVFGIWGLLPPFSLFMIAVAVFVYLAAGAEYRMVVWQDALQNPFSSFFDPPGRAAEPDEDEEVVVSPPPYARRGTDTRDWWQKVMRRQRELFDRLFEDWSQR